MKTTRYIKEFYIESQFVDKILIDTPDRDVFGFPGMRKETTDHDMKFKRKRIKAGTEIRTLIYPIQETR